MTTNEYLKAKIADYVSEHPDAKLFVNLGGGIEAVPILDEMGLSYSFANIRSTQLEDGDAEAVLDHLPADLLMSLACGKRCAVIDTGCRKEYSRAIWQGVPFVRFVLDKVFYDTNADAVYVLPRRRNGRLMNELTLYRQWLYKVRRNTLRYLKRFRPYAKAMGNGDCVLLDGISCEAVVGDKNERAEIMREFF